MTARQKTKAQRTWYYGGIAILWLAIVCLPVMLLVSLQLTVRILVLQLLTYAAYGIWTSGMPRAEMTRGMKWGHGVTGIVLLLYSIAYLLLLAWSHLLQSVKFPDY